jgi:lipoprotein-releasing system permease protein
MGKTTDGFLSFISWVSVVGVALGVLALVVVTAVINGFEGEIARAVTGLNGSVLLYTRGNTVEDSPVYTRKISDVLGFSVKVAPSLVAEMMISGPRGVVGGVLEGIDPERAAEVTRVLKSIVKGRAPLVNDEVVLGESLANKIGVKIGDEVQLIVPLTGGDRSESFTPTASKAQVVGIAKLGMHDYDSKYFFARLDFVQKLLNLPNRVTTFKIKLDEKQDPVLVSTRLSEAFGYPFRSKPWMHLNRNLLYAIKLEKAVIVILLTAIILVAAFNVVSTLMMMIEDKSKEIAILKSIGLRPAQGFQLFALIGTSIGIVGVFAGVILGLLINEVLKRIDWIKIPPDIYSIGFLPVQNRWFEVLIIALVGVFFTFLASVYPAMKVAFRSPLMGLKDDN